MATNDERKPPPSDAKNCLLALCWSFLSLLALTAIGAAIGAYVYLPGPLDGWFYFHLILFGSGGLLIGVPVSIVVLALLLRKQGDK